METGKNVTLQLITLAPQTGLITWDIHYFLGELTKFWFVMRFQVCFVDEGKLAKVEEKRNIKSSGNSQKTFRYELPKNTDLPLHVLNIHKSLTTLGFGLLDSPQHFTLRMRPICETNLKEFPAYLPTNGPAIDSEIIKLSNLLTKIQRKKGFTLELVLTPSTRAKRFLTILQDPSVPPLKIKETAFNLASQTKDPIFASAFVTEGGIQVLLSLLDTVKGNTIAYIVNALGASLQGNENGLQALLKNDGVSKLFKFIESSVLSIQRRTVEVLHYICYTGSNWDLIYTAACLDDAKGFQGIFNHLESVDLHTRLAALRIVNQMIDKAPCKEKREEILSLAVQYNVPFSLQKSLSITVPEVVKALRRFEVVTGIVLSKVDGSGQALKDRVKELEKEVKTLQELRNSSELLVDFEFDSLENEIGELSFDNIDFTEDLEFEAVTEEGSEVLSGAIDSPRVAKTILDKQFPNVNLKRKGSVPTGVRALKGQLEVSNEEITTLREEIERLKKEKEESARISPKQFQKLKEEMERAKEENECYKNKIVTLTETVQTLINETNPTLACEHCVNEPGMVFRLDVENRVRNSTVVTPLSPVRRKKSEETQEGSEEQKGTEDELEKKRQELQNAVDDLQQQKYAVEMDKYQLSLDVDRLQNEYEAAKAKKKKLRQVVQNLSAKRETLMKECEATKQTHSKLKEDIETFRDIEQAFIQAEKNMVSVDDADVSASELEARNQLKLMQSLVTALTRQKRELEAKLSEITST